MTGDFIPQSAPLEGERPLAAATSCVLLVLLTGLFFRGVLVGERLFAVDFHLTFQPLRTVLGESLGQGALGWNPHLSNGVPLAANPLNAAFYPVNLLLRLAPAAVGLTWLTVLHVLFGALGTYRLGCRQGLLDPGAFTAAVVVAFGGVAASSTAYLHLGWSMSWLPWLFLGLARIVAAETRRQACWGQALAGCAVAALLLLGEPFVLLGGALGGLLVFIEALGEATGTGGRRGALARWRTALALALPALFGVVVAWPAWSSYLDYLPRSLRAAGFTYEGTTFWSWHPATAIEGLLPGFFGEETLRRFDGTTGFWAAALVPEKGYPLFAGSYVGALVAALACSGFSGAGYRRWLLPTWLGLLLLLALGRHGPFGPLYALPGLEGLRYPVKWLVPAGLPLALLAGRGVDRFQRGGAHTDRPRLLRDVLLAMVVVVALSVVAQLPAVVGRLGGPGVEPFRPAVRATILAATVRGLLPLAVAAAIAFAASARPAIPGAGRRRAGWAAALLALLVGIDLVQANARLAPTVEPGFYDRVPELVQAIASDRDGNLRVRVERPRGVRFRRDPSYAKQARGQRDTLTGYTALAYGLDLAFGPDTEALHPLRYTRLQVMLESAPLRERWMLLGAAGVTHVVTHERPAYPGARLLAEYGRRTVPPLGVWRNPLAVPRARVVSRLVCYSGDEGFIAALSGAPDDLFRDAALVERDDLESAGLESGACDPLPPPGGTPVGVAAATEVAIDDGGDTLRLATRGSGGWLVVNDTWLAGWSARVDGQSTPLLRVDYVFRGIRLPPGEHRVVMTYASG